MGVGREGGVWHGSPRDWLRIGSDYQQGIGSRGKGTMGRLRQGDLWGHKEPSSIMFLSLWSGVCCRKACKQQNLTFNLFILQMTPWVMHTPHSPRWELGARRREAGGAQRSPREALEVLQTPAQSMKPWSRCLSFHLFSGLVTVTERDWAGWQRLILGY